MVDGVSNPYSRALSHVRDVKWRYMSGCQVTRERERQTDRQANRQTDRQMHTYRQTKRDREKNKEADYNIGPQRLKAEERLR